MLSSLAVSGNANKLLESFNDMLKSNVILEFNPNFKAEQSNSGRAEVGLTTQAPSSSSKRSSYFHTQTELHVTRGHPLDRHAHDNGSRIQWVGEET